MKRPWLIFLAGLLLGAGGMGFLWLRAVARDALDSWSDAQVYFDDQAREHISDKLQPSSSAEDIYFYIDGFQDPRIFIAYTDTSKHLEKLVFDLTQKHLTDLETWQDQLKDDWFVAPNGVKTGLPNTSREPGVLNKKLLTSLYDVDVIRKGRFFQKDETSWGWYLIVDEETGRFYYHSWET